MKPLTFEVVCDSPHSIFFLTQFLAYKQEINLDFNLQLGQKVAICT